MIRGAEPARSLTDPLVNGTKRLGSLSAMETATRAQRHPSRAGEPSPSSTARRLAERRRRAGAHRGLGADRVAGLRVPAQPLEPAPRRPVVLAPPLLHARARDRRRARAVVEPVRDVGTPFAADPQSGWLSLPMMASSWLFGCGGGLRALIVLNPILAGLGLFWFLREEGLGRIAATAGGLSLAMAISASIVAISLPFAGTLAWTPFVLVGASGFFARAGWRPARVARARGVRVGPGRDRPPVARAGDVHRPRRRVRGRPRDPRGATGPLRPGGRGRVVGRGSSRSSRSRTSRSSSRGSRCSRARAWRRVRRARGTLARVAGGEEASDPRPTASGARGRSRSPRRRARTSGPPSCCSSRSRSATRRRRYLVVALARWRRSRTC